MSKKLRKISKVIEESEFDDKTSEKLSGAEAHYDKFFIMTEKELKNELRFRNLTTIGGRGELITKLVDYELSINSIMSNYESLDDESSYDEYSENEKPKSKRKSKSDEILKQEAIIKQKTEKIKQELINEINENGSSIGSLLKLKTFNEEKRAYYSGLTVVKLKEELKLKNIKINSKMKKNDLINLLVEHESISIPKEQEVQEEQQKQLGKEKEVVENDSIQISKQSQIDILNQYTDDEFNKIVNELVSLNSNSETLAIIGDD